MSIRPSSQGAGKDAAEEASGPELLLAIVAVHALWLVNATVLELGGRVARSWACTLEARVVEGKLASRSENREEWK